MNRRSIIGQSAIAASALATLSGSAFAQQKLLKEQLVGTWTLVSYDSVAVNGSKKPVFGSSKGYLMLDAGGHYMYMVVDMTRNKWKSKNRTETTAEEYAAAAKGLVAQFGVWNVDESAKTLTRKVEGALNPGLPGVEERKQVVVSADELILSDPSSKLTDGRTEQVFRRTK